MTTGGREKIKNETPYQSESGPNAWLNTHELGMNFLFPIILLVLVVMVAVAVLVVVVPIIGSTAQDR